MFTRVNASAPASVATRTVFPRSGSFGASLATTGRSVRARHPLRISETASGSSAKGAPPLFASFRTGQVDLKTEKSVLPVQPLYKTEVLLYRVTGDAYQDLCPADVVADPGQLISFGPLESWVRESNGVEHTAAELGHTRGGVSSARFHGDRFRDETTQRLEIDDVLQLHPEATGPCGKEYRILEPHA